MHYQEYLQNKLEGLIPQGIQLPKGFHLVGHVALLRLNPKLMPFAEAIGNETLKYDLRIKSVAVRTGRTSKVTRIPDYTLVAGRSNTETIHKEAGVLFQVDPLRVTFSGGNITERIRMGQVPHHDEIIVDMFACIGQFALHMVKKKTVQVTAIEINPEAYAYLVRNIKLNKVEDLVTPVLGDCRYNHPVDVADRVVLGYLHDTLDYLTSALEILKPSGGVIHLHAAVPLRKISEYCNTINTDCHKNGFNTHIDVKKIKSYSPNIEHVVFDIRLVQM